MADGVPERDYRIDLAVDGRLTAVQTDGVLWYLVLCSPPDIRIMCVTYESNGMAIGDRVIVKGGYQRRDDNHVLLDLAWQTGQSSHSSEICLEKRPPRIPFDR